MSIDAELKKLDDAREVGTKLMDVMVRMKVSPEVMMEVLGPMVSFAILMHKLPYDDRIAKLLAFNADVLATVKSTAAALERHQ